MNKEDFFPIKVKEIKEKFHGIRQATPEEIEMFNEKIKKNDKVSIIVDIISIMISIILILFNNAIIGIIILLCTIIPSIKDINLLQKKHSIKEGEVFVAECDIYKKWYVSGHPDHPSSGYYYIMLSDKNKYYIKKKIELYESEAINVWKYPDNYIFKLYLFSDYNLIDCLCLPIEEIEEPKSNTNMYAVIGFILSFVILVPYIPLLGLFLSLIGLKKSEELKNGKGLSIAGIIISTCVSIFWLFIILI